MTKKEALRIKKRLERGTATAAERGVYDAWAIGHNKGRRGPKVKLSAEYGLSVDPQSQFAKDATAETARGSVGESTDPPPLGEDPVKEGPKVVAPLVISDTHKAMAAGLLSVVKEANAWNREHGARITIADDSVVWSIVGGAYERIFARYLPDMDIEGEATDELVAAGVTGSIGAQRLYLGYLESRNPTARRPVETPTAQQEATPPAKDPDTPSAQRMNERLFGNARAGIVRIQGE